MEDSKTQARTRIRIFLPGSSMGGAPAHRRLCEGNLLDGFILATDTPAPARTRPEGAEEIVIPSETVQLWRSILLYDGSPFHGWQVQPGLVTVQGTLAAALHRVTGETVLPQGSGRTDTGVHALGQVASFELEAPIPPERLLRALNRVLPPSIRMLRVEHAPANFHARHSAISKTYEYRVFLRNPGVPGAPERLCSPFLAPYVYNFRFPVDLGRANRAAAHVLGEHDFTSFAASDPDLAERSLAPGQPHAERSQSNPGRGNLRRILCSAWHAQSDELLVYRVTGSGFLHHMVRNLAGTFLDAGAGRTDPESVPRILAARNRATAGPTAPARGLFLVEVHY